MKRGTNPKSLKNLKPCKPGENRHTKQHGERDYTTIRDEAFKMLGKENKQDPQKLKVIEVANGIRKAISGDHRFYKDDLDRTYGTATQRTDVTSGDRPIPLLHVLDNPSDTKDIRPE